MILKGNDLIYRHWLKHPFNYGKFKNIPLTTEKGYKTSL